MLEGIQEVTYFVPDLEAAWAWLVSLAGAELVTKLPGMIQGRVGRSVVTLHPADEKGAAGPGGQVVYWRVRDIHQAIADFEAQGATRYRGPIVGVDGPQVAQMQDPWGNLWGLIQD